MPNKIQQDTIIKEFTQKLRQQLGDRLKEVILFGSRARGDWEEGSDYDFLIIVDKKTKEVRNIVLDIESELLNKTNKLKKNGKTQKTFLWEEISLKKELDCER